MDNNKLNATVSSGDPGSIIGEGTDSTNILGRVRSGSLCRGLVEGPSRDLPGDDAVIAGWLTAAQKGN